MRNKRWNKKATILAMLLAMVMAFAACSGDDTEKISGQITPAGNVQDVSDNDEVTPTEAVEDKAQDETENQGTDDKQDETENQEVADEDGKTTSLGRIQGGVYVNEYMGISCELDSSWTFFTAEELQELPENVAEMFENTNMEDEMSALSYISDMSAENLEDLTSMNIIYQKMSLQERLAFKSLSHGEVIDGMLTQKDYLAETYGQAGINVSAMEKKTVTFCGEEREVLWMEANVSGAAYYTLQIFDYTLGDYAVTLTVASFVEDKTEDLLTLFSKYE